MKKFASIASVVALLLVAALYYGNQQRVTQDDPTPDVTPTPDPHAVVKTPPSPDAPTTHAAHSGTLTLSAASSHGYALTNQASEVYAAIDLKAIKHEGAQRPPLNISVVIDRSGSMSGEKIEHARAAARRLVDVLSPQDRVSVVSYGSDVTVEFPSSFANAQARPQLLRAINSIEVSGGTNLSGGFERGLAEVRRWQNGDSINRVILMSDGNANIGITHIPELERMAREALQGRVTLTSIGVGLDYNEDLMTRMANQGAGNYYFVDNTATIGTILERELKGLSNTVARNTSLTITLPQGVELVELYGFPYQRIQDSLRISLAEFYSEESKNILLKLRVMGQGDNKRELMDVQLSYNDVIHTRDTHSRVGLSVIMTGDAAQTEQQVNAQVISRVQQVEVAQSMQQAMELYERGDALGASGILERQQRSVSKVRAKYAPLKKEASFDRVDDEMERMKGTIQAAPAASDEGNRLRKSSKARSNYILMDSTKF